MSQGRFQGESEAYGKLVEFGHEGNPERKNNVSFYLGFFLFARLFVFPVFSECKFIVNKK